MSVLYSALWEGIELLLAAGRVMTRSAPGVRGGPGKQALLLSQVSRKLPFYITDLGSLVLMANFKFMLAAFGCVEQHSLIASFGGSMLTWSVWLQSWGFLHAAAVVLLYPLCAEARLFLWVVVPGLALPVTQPPVSLPAHKGLGRCGRKQRSLHHHFFRTASHQDCNLKESGLHESHNI